MTQILQIDPEDAVEGFTDDQLVMAHMTMHAYYREFSQGRGDQIDNWDLQELVQKHDEIRNEMEKRELKHERINALDEEAATVTQSAEEQSDATWLFQAKDFVDIQDDRITLSEHVQLSSTPYAELAEWIQTWADTVFDDTSRFGLVAHDVNQEGNCAAFMVKQSDGYHLYLNDLEVFQSEYQDVALERFISLSTNVDEDIEQAYKATFRQQGWENPNNPDDYELANPDVEWESVTTTLAAYMEEAGYDPDEDSWGDIDQEDRVAISQYHSATSSGVPADNFSDLWGPHHNPAGEVVRSGVIAAKQANAGARSEPNRPSDLEEPINGHLDDHLVEFDEQFDDVGLPETVEQQDMDDLDEVYEEWSDTVNMTASELQEWSANGCSRIASEDPEAVIERNLNLLETNKSDWTESEIEDAERTISFVQRMRGQEPDDPQDGRFGCPSDWAVSLLNWSYNPFDEIPTEPDNDDLDEAEEIQQFRVINNADEDYKWYVWNKTEVEQWLSDQGYDAELERDGNYLRATIPTDVNQSHPSNMNAIGKEVHTVDQQGNGEAVVVRGAENLDEEFFLAVHLVGDEIELENETNLTEPLGVSAPYPDDQMVLPTAFMVDDPIPDGRRFFVVQWTNDDGEPGEIVTDEDGMAVLDDGIYHQSPGSPSVEDVVQNTGTYRSWRGSRSPPDEITQDNKPRRVVVESREDESQVKQIEFPVNRSYAQTAALVTEKVGLDKESLEGLLRDTQ